MKLDLNKPATDKFWSYNSFGEDIRNHILCTDMNMFDSSRSNIFVCREKFSVNKFGSASKIDWFFRRESDSAKIVLKDFKRSYVMAKFEIDVSDPRYIFQRLVQSDK